MGLFDKIFGTYSDRELKDIKPIVNKILELEAPYKALSDEELKGKTAQFKERYKGGESLDALLPEAFATVREASDRVLGMRPYPVQLIGGIVLHQGRIAEMKTGEGKTLTATMPAYLNALSAYLNALTGEGVHIVTVNDYLAKRDSEWMGKVHRFLGLTVGATATAEAFLNFTTIGIVIGGFLAFALSIAGGIFFVKLFKLFTKKKTNPLIGATGLSAVPMASRVANEIALKYDPKNHVLQYCMASNISGVIGSAVAAGVLISFLG